MCSAQGLPDAPKPQQTQTQWVGLCGEQGKQGCVQKCGRIGRKGKTLVCMVVVLGSATSSTFFIYAKGTGHKGRGAISDFSKLKGPCIIIFSLFSARKKY